MRCPGDPQKWPKMRRCFPDFFVLWYIYIHIYRDLYRSIQYLYYLYTPIKMFSSDRTYAKKDIWKDGAWKQIIFGDLKPSNRSNCVMIQVCPLHPLLSGQWDFTVSWQTVCYLLPHEPFIRRNPAPVDRWYTFHFFDGSQQSFWWCRISQPSTLSLIIRRCYWS